MRTETEFCNFRPVRNARKFTDGGGLYLLMQPNGGRSWRYNYRFEGKQRTLALGIYPDVSLDTARARHKEAKRQLVDGNRSLRTRRLQARPSLAKRDKHKGSLRSISNPSSQFTRT
jgi:hypothetical protein